MKKILILSIALILVSGLVFLAKSAIIDNVAEWDPTANPKDRHMVISSNGTIVVFYQGGSDPPAPGIRAKKSTDSGATWTNLEGGSGSTQVSESDTIYYSVCFDANDNIYVAYDRDSTIYFKKLTYSAGSWSLGEERAVVDMGEDQGWYPSIVRESGGRIWIAYGHWIKSTARGQLRAVYSNNEFQTYGTVANVNSPVPAPSPCYEPALTLRDATPFIVYRDYPVSRLRCSYWNGTSWASPVIVNSDSVAPLEFSVTTWGREVHVVYRASGVGVRHTYLDEDSGYSGWTTPKTLSEGPDGIYDQHPNITTDGTYVWCSASVYFGVYFGYPNVYLIGMKRWSYGEGWTSYWWTFPAPEDSYYDTSNRYPTTPSTVSTVIGRVPVAWSSGKGLIFGSYDIIPPGAPKNVDDGVSGWNGDNTPTFTWDSPYDASGIAGYYWAVDDDSPETGGNWTIQTTATTPPLSDGTHIFYVLAVDRGGNYGPTALHVCYIRVPKTFVWDGGGTNNNWSTKENWSGDTVPLSSDVVLFDSTSQKNCTLDVSATVASFLNAGGYIGTFTANNNLTVNGDFQWDGGTFNAGSSTITVSGNWDSSDGTFNYNTSTVVLTGTDKTITTPASPNWFTSRFYNLTINGSYSVQTASPANGFVVTYAPGLLTINGTFIIPAGKVAGVYGNLVINSGATLTGTGTGTFYRLVSSNTTQAITNNGTISVPNFTYLVSQGVLTGIVTPTTYNGNVTITNSNVGSATAILGLGTALTVTGNFSIYHYYSTSGSTITLNNSVNNTPITVFGNFTIASGGVLKAGSSTITVSGNWDSSAGTFNYGTSTVILNGSGTRELYAKSYSTPTFYNLSCAFSGKTTHVNSVSSLYTLGTVTLNGGTFSGINTLVVSGWGTDGKPLTTTSPSVISGSYVVYWGNATNANKTCYILGNSDLTYDIGILISVRSSATNATYALNGNLTAKYIRIETGASGVTFTTNNHNITLTGDFWTGGYNYENHTQPVKIYFNNSIVRCTNLRAGNQYDTDVTDNLYLGNSNVFISGNFVAYVAYYNSGHDPTPHNHINDWVVDPGTSSTVTLTGGTATQNIILNKTRQPNNAVNNLTITNNTNSGVTFADSLTCQTFTAITGGSRLYFARGSTFTFANMELNGQSDITRIQLRSTGTGNAWYLIVPVTGTQRVQYVDVQDSDASGGKTIYAFNSKDSLNNKNWVFNPQVPGVPVITSLTHPDQTKWYNNNDPSFSWSCSSNLPIMGYSCQLDTSPVTIPDDASEGTATSKNYTDVADGTWYFHVKAQNAAELWGGTGHYKINIDTSPPSAPQNVNDGVNGWSADDTPTFTWDSVQDISGIVGYWWAVDDDSPETGGNWTIQTTTTTPRLSEGTHTFYVKAQNGSGLISTYGSHICQIDTSPPDIPTITSLTHPDQNRWYNNNDPSFIWSASDISGITGYKYKLDQSSTTIPDAVSVLTTSTTNYTDVPSGTWHFHVKAKNGAELWGGTSHYTINIDTTIAPQYNYTITSSTSAKTSLSFPLTIELVDSATGDRMNDARANNQFKISAWIDGPNGSEQAPGSWRIVEGGTTLVNGQADIKVTYDTVGKIRFKVEDDPGRAPRYPAWPAYTELIDIQPLRLRYEVVAPEKVQAGKEFSLTIRLIDDPVGKVVTPIDYARRVSLVAYSKDGKPAEGELKIKSRYLEGGIITIQESYNLAHDIYIEASDAEDKDPAAEAGRSSDIEVIGAPETVMKLEGLYNETKDALYLRNSTLINIVCISEIKARYIYYIDNGTQRKTYEEPFSLSPGAHTIEYYGVDEYGNQEEPTNKSKRIYVAFFGDNADGLTNIPNPFKAGREETSIEYKLKEPSNVAITIYDLLAQEVWHKSYPAGENGGKESNNVSWDGRNLSGKVVANGGYVCRIWIAREKRYLVRKIGVAK